MTTREMQKLTKYINQKYGDLWPDFNSACYNELLHVEMLSMNFICAWTLRKMGIIEDVYETLTKMGLGMFALPHILFIRSWLDSSSFSLSSSLRTPHTPS